MLSRLMNKNRTVNGSVRCGALTKQLVASIKPGEIAVISHTDIDELAARGLLERRVKAVVNCAPSFTGEYMARGAKILLDHHIPLYDCDSQDNVFEQLHNGEQIIIDGHYLFRKKDRHLLARLSPITKEYWQQACSAAEQKMNERLYRFVENTLAYAAVEKEHIMLPLPPLPLHTPLAGRTVVIVSRGKYYKEDLRAIRPYILKEKPILIGVDGGADALLENGLVPDIVIGDMDSVSNDALAAAKDVIIHAYYDGTAPGEKRVRELGIPYYKLRAPGISEDAAMLYAYHYGAEWLVSVGTHTNMVEFLEKGRQGMASTLLVRMQVGDRVIDAKGFHLLYSKRQKRKE